MAQRVVDRWAENWRRNDSGLTFSAGITDLVGQDALSRADISLYAAKAAGRARTMVGQSGNAAGIPAAD